MRYFGRTALSILLFAVYALPQTTAEPTSPPPDETAEIRKLMSEIEQSFVSRDAAPFERIYLDSYVGIRSRAVYNAFEPLIAMIRWDAAAIKSGKKLDFETLSFENENPAIRIMGDAAIATGLKKNLWRYRDARCLNRYQSTDVFVKTDGRWRLALGHMSLIPCDPAPRHPPHPAIEGIRDQTKPSRNLTPATETEIRDLLGKVVEASLGGGNAAEGFSPDFLATSVNNEVSGDRGPLLAAFRTPTSRSNERYRDDEAFLSFGGNVAAFIFRIRSLAKVPETRPDPPVTHSVIFVKQNGQWKIVAAHASTI
jgi:ketosteroid isomerase-like protein